MPIVRIDWAAVDRMLNSPAGMVGRDCQQRADRTAAQARQFAPGSMSESIAPPVVQRGAAGPSAEITVRHHAVGYVIQGTPPHPIRPRPPKRALRFTVGGRIVFAAAVNHPGTKPNDFLNKALPAAL
ncbi:hypothetical protein [Streptomyces dubilierae]|uniref:Uncharacterized protein n=1 Tax=Streptomyces dubilierae TaxID=3075533 RepID=A0ABU2P6P0_9ACTN|nr:hypothetical protein [Streptomyces sp. DSM 41921]MDT0387812.1 hypothetical protein [Streptomyces sp. DSM 41921]